MIVRPQLQSHFYINGTLFDNLELHAEWLAASELYKFVTVQLSYRPPTSRRNLYAPWEKTEDRRFKARILQLDFGEFCAAVQEALTSVVALENLVTAAPNCTELTMQFSAKLAISTKGFFLTDWPWAPIFDNTAEIQKAAAVAVLELLHLEASLPAQQLCP